VNTRITTGMLQRNILADLTRTQGSLARTQEKLSSLKEINRPSDDPAGTAKALRLRESLRGNQQHQRNVDDATSWTDATETALSSMTDILQRARELAVRGASESTDPVSRKSIALEIDQLVSSLKDQANTKFAGKYLFSGTMTDTAPYGSTDAYQGNTSPVAREIGPGVSVAINTTADTLLGSGQGAADGKLLAVLGELRDHLVNNDTAALQGDDLTKLDAGLDLITAARTANGAITNRLDSAKTRLASIEEMTTRSLSGIEDVDVAKTIIDYTTQNNAYQAALKAGANIVQSSLMDFLR